MTYRFGDVVLAPMQFTDQTGQKNRPAVVASSDRYNADRPDVVLMPITTTLTRFFGTVPVRDWQVSGLRAPSVIKPTFFSLEIPLVKRTLGRLDEETLEALRETLAEVLG